MDDINQTSLATLIKKLYLWLNEKGQLPILEIIDAYHDVGKHFVSNELHSVLAKVRKELVSDLKIENKLFIQQLINTLLDKYDNKYDYCSYLGLELLGLPDLYKQKKKCTTAELDRRKLLLGYDIIRFELSALNAEETWLPLRSAPKKLVIYRCYRVLKVIKAPLQRLKIKNPCTENGNIVKQCEDLGKIITQGISKEEFLQLKCTMIPVYKVHDEYMFIRVLQSFETIFTWIAITLQQAINLGKNDINQTITLIQQCTLHLIEAFPLFTILATMRSEAFMEFRIYTEGASAIQSRSYKQIESLCRRPDEKRLNSIAYHSVPEVKNLILSNRPTLEDIYSQIIAAENDTERTSILSTALNNFATEFHRWKTMHYGLAARILGKNAASGTGYTIGPPYLKDASNISVFNNVLNANVRKSQK